MTLRNTNRVGLGRRLVAAAVAAAMGLAAPAASLAERIADPTEDKSTYFNRAKAQVTANNKVKQVRRQAKNVILFIGDGMGVSTVTAARILEGQLNGQPGEENLLAFDRFPHVALSKVYQHNQQTPDSAPTMTSMVTGVKTNDSVLGLSPAVLDTNDVAGALNPANRLTTILDLAEDRGMWTGIVSTARVTHATPAANYAKSPNRNWEADTNLSPEAAAAGFKDIAAQLVDYDGSGPNDGVEVVMGGGREYFRRTTDADPEDAGRFGRRNDRDLTADWVAKGNGAAFVYDQAGFDAINPATTGPVLALFERSHVEYEADRAADTAGEPSLTDMTNKAIDVLKRSDKGFYLQVEAGRIDHAHHEGKAKKALLDTIEFSRAVRAAVARAPKDTLIIVSADHSHVFTIAGYPTRGNDILGLVVENDANGLPAAAPVLANDDRPYTTLGYQNGPGASTQPALRADLTGVDTTDKNFLQQALVPLGSETHAAEDVAIYATGPYAFLFNGTMEQNAIFHVMAKALNFDTSDLD